MTCRKLLLAAGLLAAAPALAQKPPAAPPSQPAEPLFWQTLAADQPEQLHAYLRAFPNGPHAAEARQRLGGAPPQPLDVTETVTLAAALQRGLVPQQPIPATDAATGGPCTVLPNDVVAVQEFSGAQAEPALKLGVLASRPGGCAAGTLVEAPLAAVQPLLEGFATRLQARRVPQAAGPEEAAAWTAVAAANDPSEEAAFLRQYPGSAFAELAMARLVAAVRAQAQPPAPAGAAPQAAAQPDAMELAFWQSAERQNTPAAYQAYLARFPQGIFAPLAQAALGQAAPSPAGRPVAQAQGSTPEQVENALKPGRDYWSQVQRALNALGLNAGDPDGLPGQRTRQAVQAFQRSQRVPETGFLDQALVTALQAAALEPLRRQALEERIAWDQAQQSGSADAVQAFVRRYPWGSHTEQASQQLERLRAAAAPTSSKPPPAPNAAPQPSYFHVGEIRQVVAQYGYVVIAPNGSRPIPDQIYVLMPNATFEPLRVERRQGDTVSAMAPNLISRLSAGQPIFIQER